MTPHIEQELWSHAHAALDAGRQPLDDKRVLETLARLLASDEAAPELGDWISELAGLEVALDNLPRPQPRFRWRHLPLAAAAAALVLLTAVFWPNPSSPPLPTPGPLQVAASPPPIQRRPPATIKALAVTVRRQDAPIHLDGQSLQITTTRTLHKPR